MLSSITEAVFWDLCLLDLITNYTKEGNFYISLDYHTQAGVKGQCFFCLGHPYLFIPPAPCENETGTCVLDE